MPQAFRTQLIRTSMLLASYIGVGMLPAWGSNLFVIEGTNYVQAFDATTLAPQYFFIPSAAPQGLAYGNGDLYLTYGTTIVRDNLSGTVLSSDTQGSGLNLGSVTYAGSLVFAVEGTNYVQSFDSTTLSPQYFFIPAAAPQAIAYGDGYLYVTHGNTIDRDDLSGNVLASHTQGAGLNLGNITVAGSVVYVVEGTNYVQSFDAMTLAPISFFIPSQAPQGLAFANPDLYVTHGNTLERDSGNGNVLASYTTGAGLNLGEVAVADTAAPEPMPSALIAVGLLAMGTLFRRRSARHGR